MMHRRTALHALLVGATAPLYARLGHAAPCAMIGLRPYCWTPDDAELPLDGAVVLSLEAGGSMAAPALGTPPPASQRVLLRYLDRLGRLSPPSNVVVAS